MKGVKRVHPSPLSPHQSLGKAKAWSRRSPIAPRMKALTFQALLRVQRGTGIRLCWGGNKAVWENNKYFLSICLFFFFFNLFLYFISLQILSVCLTYILYIVIYQYSASL